MSLQSNIPKIANAITPADADEAALASALDAVEAARASQSSLYNKREKIASADAAKRRDLADAALKAEETDDDKAYRAIEMELVKLAADAARVDQAQSGAGVRLHLAEVHLHKMGVQSHARTARRLCTARSKAATALCATLADYTTHFAKVLEIDQRLVQSWPYGPVPYGGTMLSSTDVVLAVQQELARLVPRHGLDKQIVAPGTADVSPYADQFQFKPLLETLELANQVVIEAVERGPNK